MVGRLILFLVSGTSLGSYVVPTEAPALSEAEGKRSGTSLDSMAAEQKRSLDFAPLGMSRRIVSISVSSSRNIDVASFASCGDAP